MKFGRVDVLSWVNIINISIVMILILSCFLLRVFRLCVSIILFRFFRSEDLTIFEQSHTNSSMTCFWQSFSMMIFSEFDVFRFCHQSRKIDISEFVIFFLKMMFMFIVKTNKIKTLTPIVLYMIQIVCRATRDFFWHCCENFLSFFWLFRKRSRYFSKTIFWDGVKEQEFFSNCINVFWSSCSDIATSGIPENMTVWKKKQREKKQI